MADQRVSTSVSPEFTMRTLSKHEVDQLRNTRNTELYPIFRCCALAVLNCGGMQDDTKEILDQYQDFDINVVQQSRGIKLQLINAPTNAFVDGKMIRGIKEHLFTVLRDVIFISSEIRDNTHFDLSTSEGKTNAVFQILRNANILIPDRYPNMVVCWGGHSISRHEYDYTKEVGHQMGLRNLDVCTGCGPGAMKGPMKGANVGHAKQRIRNGRYLGISEPGIIAAESPNPIVNELVIMPDIEKRLEAFVRVAHGIVVFPGGAGTAEEILFLLGVLLHPSNQDIPLPVIFTAPESSKDYFTKIDQLIGSTLGKEAQSRYEIIINDPSRIASKLKHGMELVKQHRRDVNDAYYYNWSLTIDPEFQQPFEPTHENMAQLNLSREQPSYLLAANLRRCFSAIVAGNVKEVGIKAIAEKGPFEIKGDKSLMESLDELLKSFAQQKRMKLNSDTYRPCYKIV